MHVAQRPAAEPDLHGIDRSDPRLKGLKPDVDLTAFTYKLQKRAEKAAQLRAIYDYIIIVCGSRDFNDYAIFKDVLEMWLNEHPKVKHGMHVFVSGGAWKGADEMVIRWCEEYPAERPIAVFPALWDEYVGKTAGYKRNAEMGDFATHCIGYWDCKSPGTKHMLDYAEKKGLVFQKVLVDPD